jgi:D-alanyl-D-alanine carboxypeptidase
MALPVLEPVHRRRRRRRRHARRLDLLVLGILLLAAAAAVFWRVFASGGGSSAPPPRPTRPRTVLVTRHQARQARQVRLLAAAPPLLHGGFDPLLGGRSAVLVDASSGRVLWTLRPHLRLPIASTTKIMTATLVLQHLPLHRIVRIGPTVPRVPLVREGLRTGERVPAWKLMYGLLLYSGNDDALALAIATAGSRPAFLSMMNREARLLGLHDSHFTSPSGVIDDGNFSSAWDLAALGRYALRDPRFRRIVRTRRIEVPWAPPTYSKIYVNKNRLLTLYPGTIGIKTGWTTRAGPCIVAAATRRGVTLIAVVLDSPRLYNDAARLLNRGFAQFG